MNRFFPGNVPMENADTTGRCDLEEFFDRLVPKTLITSRTMRKAATTCHHTSEWF